MKFHFYFLDDTFNFKSLCLNSLGTVICSAVRSFRDLSTYAELFEDSRCDCVYSSSFRPFSHVWDTLGFSFLLLARPWDPKKRIGGCLLICSSFLANSSICLSSSLKFSSWTDDACVVVSAAFFVFACGAVISGFF